MISVYDIYRFLDDFAPFNTAMKYDNSGLIVGDYDRKISKVLISLDITIDVVQEAKKLGVQLIVSHHPIIFKAIKNLRFNSALHLLSKFEISAICAHTNLDTANYGVNFEFAKTLELVDLLPLTYEENQPMGLLGSFNTKMDNIEFARFVKDKLGCKGLRYTNTNTSIRKVAICSGSGGELVSKAIEKGADVFITGEIKHNQIIEANENSLMVIDVGHYKSENMIVFSLQRVLKNKFNDVDFFVSETFSDRLEYL